MRININDFDKICRTCLNIKKDMKSLFLSETVKKFNILMNVQTEESDESMPKNICADCSEEIDRFYNFKNLCENSNLLLREILAANESSYSSSYLKTESQENLDFNYESDVSNLSILKTYPCNHCTHQTENLNDLFAHINNFHKSQLRLYKNKCKTKSYTCKTCNKLFLNTANLKRHERIHQTRERTFWCQLCEKSFIEESCLKSHNRRYHQGTKREREKCTVCNKSVLYLKIHMLHRHSDVKPYSCSQCTESFVLKCYLKQHVIKKHEKRKSSHKGLCSTCGRTFSSEAEAKRHMVTHTNNYDFACHLCDKKYKWNKHLKEHLRTHTNERPYLCNFCSKCFTASKTLKTHLRTHTGEKPYACRVCTRAFTQYCSLKMHMKVHLACNELNDTKCNKSLSIGDEV